MDRHSIFFVILVLTFTNVDLAEIPLVKGKIVGGTEADIENFPYQAAVLIGSSQLCGGSLIRFNWVLCAAHCTKGESPSNIQVRVGSSFARKNGVIMNVDIIINHPDYVTATKGNDISLMKMVNGVSVEQSDKYGIKIIPLAENFPQPPTVVWVTGYGATSFNGPLSDSLRKVQVRIMDRQKCNESYDGILTWSMQCAGLPDGGKDACQGDSGGPLAYDGRLIGVVSWGDGCALAGYPGIYTSVPWMREWILFNVNYN